MECRAADAENVRALDSLVDEEATACAAAERQVLATLQAGCTAPVAAYATRKENGELTLRAGVFALDGATQLVETVTGTDAVEVGTRAAEALVARGAKELME
mgnify:FL=1